MTGVITSSLLFYEAEFGNLFIYVEGSMILLDVLRMIILMSKYFFLIMVRFCGLLVIVNNMMYLVILRGVLMVVFVTSMLIRSLTNSVVPFLFPMLSIKGGGVFMIMIRVVVFL